MPNLELGKYSDQTFVSAQSNPLFMSDGTQPLPLQRQFPDAVFSTSFNERSERPQSGEGTAAWIKYFDNAENRNQEGLPSDWYNLRNQGTGQTVGFLMQRQIEALRRFPNREDWARKTRRDLQGFKLEFLSNHIVYPRKYTIEKSGRIEDPMYGKAKDRQYKHPDIQEVVSEEERNGSVKWAMGEIKQFMADAPTDSMTILTSPRGPSGLKTDGGIGIDYPDTYFFVMRKQKNEDTQKEELVNYTIKTNFSLSEARAVIARITDSELTKDDPLEAYAYALAKIKPGDKGINNIFDIIQILEDVHPANPFVDKQIKKVSTWQDVRDDIVQGEQLYGFDQMTTAIIDEFTAYAEEEGHTDDDLQKAIAVAILRMGEQFFTREESQSVTGQIVMERGSWISPGRGIISTFGDALKKTAARPGCAGGGGSTAAIDTGGGMRLGAVGEDKYGSRNFECPECGKTNTRDEGELLSACLHCGSKSVAC